MFFRMEKTRVWEKHYWQVFFLLFLSSFFIFLATWHGVFQGYERETADAALALLDGRYEIKRAGLGAVVLYVPFALIGFAFSPRHLSTFLTLVPLFYSALEVAMIFLCLNRLTKQITTSVAVSLLIAFGSSLWPYSTIGMEYQAGLLVSVLFLALLRWRDGDGSILTVGIIAAYLAITKSYGSVGLLASVVSVFFVMYDRQKINWKKFGQTMLPLVAPAIVLLGLQVTLNIWLYGQASGAYSLAHEFQLWNWWEGFYGFFFSAGKSIFLYNPLLVVALFLWPKFCKRDPMIGLFVITILILLLLINAPFSYWTDETWGPRKLVPIIALLHLPLIELWAVKRAKLMWGIIGLLAVGAIYVQFLGSAYNYDRELIFLRSVNMDSLASIRFIPELSHEYVYHRLWSGYIGIGSDQFVYSEPSWFRWTVPGERDVVLRGAKASLRPWVKPDILWLTGGGGYKKIILTFLMLGAAGSIWSIYYICRKNKAGLFA